MEVNKMIQKESDNSVLKTDTEDFKGEKIKGTSDEIKENAGIQREKKWKLYLRLPALLVGYLLLLLALIILETGEPFLGRIGHEYLDFDVLFSSLLIPAVILALNGMGHRYLKGWKIALGFEKEKGYSLTELRRSLEAIRFARMTIFAVSGIIAMINLIDILYLMDNLNVIGPAVANVFVSIFYACVLLLFHLPVEGRLKDLQVGYMDEGEEDEPVEDEQTLYFRLRGMGLTDREAEVARLVAVGMSNKDIGKELYISDGTVKKHITHILEKTKCNCREELAEMVRGRR